jgi:hypothetical protein
VTLTPDDPLLYSHLYYVEVAAVYQSASAIGAWEFTTAAE